MPLTAESLAQVMGNRVSMDRYRQLFPAYNDCLIQCGCTTVKRAAMLDSQIYTESGGLKWMEEIADGSAYEGRSDLGNTQPGDGKRFKGRGPIQVTGRWNYTNLSKWAYGKGYIPTPTFFVDNPEALASDKYGFLGVVWYWTTQRPLNDAADAGDVTLATKYVNGGTHGLDERKATYGRALQMGESIVPDMNLKPVREEDRVGWYGDPTYLADVLHDALGDRLIVEDGWENRGTGDGVDGGNQMGDNWGVMIHHTGNINEKVATIRDGRSDLAGPLSQCLFLPNGKVHLIAIGPCNHAGIGSYPGIPPNTGNTRLIGFECCWPTLNPSLPLGYDPNELWKDELILSMRDATAGVLKFLKYNSSRCIGHKEWAGATQGKWDPGNMSMDWFRGEVQKDIDGKFDEVTIKDPPVQPNLTLPPDYAKETWEQLRTNWPQLGNRSLVDAVALIGEKLEIPGMFDVYKKKD